ncbi:MULTISPECIES: porin [Sulfurimonas]|uniref:porin n=1 Tax=Sulfurimonas TaxID=202746 RepID=UPI00165FBFF8|nr:porin [Sulfurimonas indica]
MKKNMVKLAAGAAAVLLMATSAEAGYTMKKKVGDVDTKLTFFGFAQLEAVGGKGMQIKEAGSVDKASSDIAFRAQRIRLGWKYVAGKVRGKVFLDFNQDHSSANGGDATDGAAMPKMIKDAFISYVADPAFVIKAGLIKMPNGMSFTMPGWNLDIAERGFDKSLALERNTGLMISGRGIGYAGNKVDGFEMGHERPWKGFGYDIMIANQANRSSAVNSTEFGGNSYAVRGMFDWTEKFHMEASYAVSENADGNDALTTNGEDYSNINVGIDSNLGKLSLKAEFFDAKNILGTKDYDETVYTATAGYFVTPKLELVAKHLQGSAQKGATANTTKLGNTYLGFNLFLSQPYSDFSRKAKRARNQHKVVFNYILASGSGATEDATSKWSGLSGYRDDAFIAQYQFKF